MPAAKSKATTSSTSPWGGGSALSTANGGWGGAAAGAAGAVGERPRFMGIKEMQKSLREAGKQAREAHERNERQLQVVRREEWGMRSDGHPLRPVLLFLCFVCVAGVRGVEQVARSDRPPFLPGAAVCMFRSWRRGVWGGRAVAAGEHTTERSSALRVVFCS